MLSRTGRGDRVLGPCSRVAIDRVERVDGRSCDRGVVTRVGGHAVARGDVGSRAVAFGWEVNFVSWSRWEYVG